MKPETKIQEDANRAPIAPEKLAAKLQAIRNYELPNLQEQIEKRPRLVELLWFIQAKSLQPGGLAKFCEEMLAEFPERLGTPTMRSAKGADYTLKQKAAIWREMGSAARPYIPQETPKDVWGRHRYARVEIEEMEVKDRVVFTEALKKLTAADFAAPCRKAALGELPHHLVGLCTEKHRNFETVERDADPADDLDCGGKSPLSELWYFHDVIGAIFELMDRQATRAQKRLAMTEVAKRIFDTLDFALAEKVMVRIEGDSRFGKSEAMETWCGMRPGLARLVRVPSDNSMKSFLVRIGEALGINCSYGSSPALLKYKVEFIIRNSGLFLVLDEGHFLIPQNYSLGSAPARLNWVRTEIVDRDLPVAMAVTPQSFKPALTRFVKKTGYTMEQFFGRNFLTCVLPTALGEEDMIAVARIHFPELDEDALGYIASEATLSQNYLQAMEAIARRARYLAARGKRRIGLKEIETAVSEVLPRNLAAPAGPCEGAAATSHHVQLESPRKGTLRRINEPLTAVSRGSQSVRGAGAAEPILSVRSLRGAGPVRPETELVPAGA